MLSKLALAATVGLTSAAPMPQNKPFIVGGVEASAGEFPFIVSLQRNGNHFCGGTLIAPDVVLTAGHCSDYPASSVTIRAGTTTYNSGGVTSGVRSITVHPDFNGNTLDNDIAVWHLDSSVTGSGTGVADLVSSGSDPSSGTVTTVAGWGLTDENGSNVSPNLLKVDVPIIDRATCADQYSSVGPVTDNMICAGYPEGEKDACSGDSGGPLVDSSNTLVGIVSWGAGCARASQPGVYTHVGNYIEWIANNL